MNRKALIKEFYKGNKLNFLFLLLASLVEALTLILVSLMLEKLLSIAASENMKELKEQGLLFLIILSVDIFFYLVLIYIKPLYKRKALNQYKNNIYNAVLNKSISSFNQFQTSSYISSLTNDVNYLQENYLFTIFTLITQICVFVSSLVIMFIYNAILTLSAIFLSIIPFVISLFIGGKLTNVEKTISDSNASFMHYVKDNLIGFTTIKVFKAERKMRELFKTKNEGLELAKAKETKVYVLLEFAQSITSLIAQLGVFFVGTYLCIKTDKLEASVILLFVQLMNYILNPLLQVPTLLSKRASCIPLIDKIVEMVGKAENEEKNEVIFEDSIEVKDLSFAYDEKVILDKVSYKFLKNKSYLIVGSSGSGKTTLLNLLAGRNYNYSGIIKYDEQELKNLSIDSLYEQASYIEQNVFVFDDTIENNITMFTKFDEEVLKKVIIEAGLEKLIKEKGLEYTCGENGCNLSGGEKQRIAIARGLLKKAKIMFLDEITSALDNEMSNEVINNILDLKKITKIMITHKLEEAILQRFDQIIVMKNGKIVETGTFEELMEINKIFKSLYELRN